MNTGRNVYLAGKVTKNGWRQQFVPTLRNAYGANDEHYHWPSGIVDGIAEGVHYTGPFFIGCDHGCGHYSPHANGAGGCVEVPAHYHDSTGGHGDYADLEIRFNSSRRHDTAKWCLEAIERSDLVIALIADDAHGTLIEVGYALGTQKTVWITTQIDCDDDDEPLIRDAWFALHAPHTVMFCCMRHTIDVVKENSRRVGRTAKEEALCESPVELAFLREMRKAPQLDRFTPNVKVMGGKYRIDFADPHSLVGVEIDGYAYHSDKDTFIRDRQRQRTLEQIGWRLIRFAGSEVHHDPANCVAQFRSWLTPTPTT